MLQLQQPVSGPCLGRASALWRYGRPDAHVDTDALFPTDVDEAFSGAKSREIINGQPHYMH